MARNTKSLVIKDNNRIKMVVRSDDISAITVRDDERVITFTLTCGQALTVTVSNPENVYDTMKQFVDVVFNS